MGTETVRLTVVCTEHHHNDERDAESRRLIKELQVEIQHLADQPKYDLIRPWLT